MAPSVTVRFEGGRVSASWSGPGWAEANKKERAFRPALDHRLIPKPELLAAI
ncbi:MAG: hypothetical protein ACRCU1_08395 [Alsobacter sp.]|jgi:hypothetical protein